MVGYTKDDLENAIKAVMGGQRIAHSASDFNIPSSTLCEKVKFAKLKSNLGELNVPMIKNKFSINQNYKKFRSRLNANYTEEDLENAIEAMLEGGRLTHIARIYGIPPVTLYDNVKKRKLRKQF